jgi:hypothetical protein
MMLRRSLLSLCLVVIAMLGLSACGGHKKESTVKFTAFGTRVLVNGKPHVVLTKSASFDHCQSQPLMRLTANYLWSGIKKGFSIPAKTSWVYNALDGTTAVPIHTTDEPYKYNGKSQFLNDIIFSKRSVGFSDGAYSITAKFGDKPQLRNTIRVGTKKSC